MVCARGPAPAGQGRAGALSLLRQVTAGHSRLRGTAGQPRLVTAGHSRPGEGTFAPTVQQVVDSLVKRGPASAAFSGSRPRGPAQEGGRSPPKSQPATAVHNVPLTKRSNQGRLQAPVGAHEGARQRACGLRQAARGDVRPHCHSQAWAAHARRRRAASLGRLRAVTAASRGGTFAPKVFDRFVKRGPATAATASHSRHGRPRQTGARGGLEPPF